MIPKYYDLQALRITENPDDIKTELRKYEISALSGVLPFNGYYIYIISIGTNWHNQSVTTAWDPAKMQSIGSDDKFITGMAKMGKLWEVYSAQGTGVRAQQIIRTGDWEALKDFMRQQWSRGYDITDMCEDEGNWYAVSSYGLDLKQAWVTSPELPVDEIRKYTKKGQLLTEVLRSGNTYLWMFSSNTGFNDQKIIYGPTYDEIEEIRKALLGDNKYNGYSLASIKELNGKLLFIFFR